MNAINPGHVYELFQMDCDSELLERNLLTFVKREGPGYPGNVGHHAGTNLQDVMRALIDRVKYLNNQIPAFSNRIVLLALRVALLALEIRAARRHHRSWFYLFRHLKSIEALPFCQTCGHIGCEAHVVLYRRVVAAIITYGKNLFLIGQRKPEQWMGGKWCFCGGKVEEGETDEAALQREVKEELGIDIHVGMLFHEQKQIYKNGNWQLVYYFCEMLPGQTPHKIDVSDFAFVTAPNLQSFDLMPVDIDVAEKILGWRV
jgi:8-oxo-dGTP diphosphatase